MNQYEHIHDYEKRSDGIWEVKWVNFRGKEKLWFREEKTDMTSIPVSAIEKLFSLVYRKAIKQLIFEPSVLLNLVGR